MQATFTSPPNSILRPSQGGPEVKNSSSEGEREMSSVHLLLCDLFSLDELLIINYFESLSSSCSKEMATSFMSGSQKRPLIVQK